jgi:C1A family cysteine protease
MFMHKLKKFLAGLLAVSAVLCGGNIPANAENDSNFVNYGTGYIPFGEEEEERFFESTSEDSSEFRLQSNSNVRTSFPSSVDLSQSSYFPPIGNQGSLGSCMSWASTYYQFTYEAHKLNNITTTYDNSYSPRWTFNFTNYGYNHGTNWESVYNVLALQGAVTMEEAPYDLNNYDYSWINNENAMVNALKTRMISSNSVSLNTSINQITSKTDSALDALKQKLNDGKVLSVGVISNGGLGNWSTKLTTSGETAVYRASCNAGENAENGGHALVIVGYNDNIECDFNGNGTIEESEKGAFKLANSWGTGFGNNGFIWVMYDALNYVSANTTNNWEAGEPATRTAIFDRNGGSNNIVTSINVANQTVNLAAVVNFTSDDCHHIQFFTNRSAIATSYDVNYEYLAKNIFAPFANTQEVPTNFYGAFALDFGTLDDNIVNYLSGYKWYVRMKNLNSSYPATLSGYKLVDDAGNTVKTSSISSMYMPAGSVRTINTTLNLQLGDINYDGILTSDDSQSILQYMVNLCDFSSLQKILADVDQDGDIDIIDVLTLNQSMLQNNQITAEEVERMLTEYHDYVAEVGIETMQDFYEYFSMNDVNVQ